MKKDLKHKLIFLFMLAIGLMSCKDKTFLKVSFTGNVPVYMGFDEFRNSVKFKIAENMVKTGKIYFYNNYVFINELYKGVHIINNADPTNPQNIGFIEILGNVDISVRGNFLFADSYVDLVVLDISDINNPVEVERVKNAFPNSFPATNTSYPIAPVDATKGVVVDWTIENVTVKYDNDYYYDPYAWNSSVPMFDNSMGVDILSEPKAQNIAGVGGSLARFAIKENTLFAINNQMTLKIFNISTPQNVATGDSINIWSTIETLFVDGDNLFIGGTMGMMIYNITNPNSPSMVSQIMHVTSCDPVVVDGDLAYVTLRTGTTCMGSINELQVINITNISNPLLIAKYPMTNPYGLGIKNNTLFVCDGSAGLKIYDATDPLKISEKLIANYPNINSFDVIPLTNILLLIAEDGLYQYDYSNLNDIKLLSHLSTN